MISLTSFTGEIPRTLPHLLPDNAAQEAIDCDFSAGALLGIKVRSLVSGLNGSTTKSLYVHDSAAGNTYTWNREVVALRGPIVNDAYSRFYWLDTDGQLYVSRGDIGSGEPTGTNKYKVGVPYPTSAPTISNIVAGSSTYIVHRAYVYTYVNQYGEEGPPSDAAECDITEDGTLTLSIPVYANSDGYCPISAIRIYRAATGSGSTSYLFHSEVINSGTISFTDAMLDSDLGEALDTLDFYPPPTGLTGIVALPNGIFAMSKGNQICFSEQYLPYACIPDNVITTASKVIGMCPAEGGMYVTTTTMPCFVSGSTPDAMSSVKITAIQAGVSRGSICNLGQFVVYASNDGLVQARGVNVDMSYSNQLFIRDDWRDLYKSKLHLMRLDAHDGNLLCWFTDGTPGFLIRFEGEALSLTKMTDSIDASFIYPLGDALYVVSGASVYEFKGGATRKAFSWTSKDFLSPTPINLGAILIRGTGGLTYEIYADDVKVDSETVTLTGVDYETRSTSGFMANKWKVKLIGSAGTELLGFKLGGSFKELTSG